jgi:hypothetical protein
VFIVATLVNIDPTNATLYASPNLTNALAQERIFSAWFGASSRPGAKAGLFAVDTAKNEPQTFAATVASLILAGIRDVWHARGNIADGSCSSGLSRTRLTHHRFASPLESSPTRPSRWPNPGDGRTDARGPMHRLLR